MFNNDFGIKRGSEETCGIDMKFTKDGLKIKRYKKLQNKGL